MSRADPSFKLVRVAPSWLQAKGFGVDRPLTDPRALEGRARNQRIEIRVLPP